MGALRQADLLRKLMTLALVEVDESKLEGILRDLEKIVEMFNKIRDLNLPDELEPLYTTYFGEGNVREDVEGGVTGSEGHKLLSRELEDGYLKAPRTL
jgi:aspartyl/glutamyl-tRNA(Asn/Gln) amidotransferase C subunit